MIEDFRTLYCDPGEDFGWCVGKGMKLLAGGIEKMWPTADEIWASLQGDGSPMLDGDTPHLRNGVSPEDNSGPIKRVVCEDFRIYPWAAKELSWNPVRTARVIGAITFMCRVHNIELVFQPAAIKQAAQNAGAEELYYHPLYPNRHVNDAIQHFVFYTQTTMRGIKLAIPNQGVQEQPA
jgi:hypothetical protein